MNHKKSLSATFASHDDSICWTEMPSLAENKGKSKKWLQEESMKGSNNERLDLESFSSFSFTTIHSNNEQLSKGLCDDSTSEEGSMRMPIHLSSLFNPKFYRHSTPMRRNNCTFTRIDSTLVNPPQHRNKPSPNESHCDSGMGDSPTLIISEGDTKPPSSMLGVTILDDTQAEKTSCSNTTVASDSSSSSESHLVMDILSTGSSGFFTDEYIKPCSPSVNSNQWISEAEDIASVGRCITTSNSSYKGTVTCDNSERSNGTYDEESLTHQSTENESKTETCPETHIHYLPKHWQENGCMAVKDDNSSTSAPLFIGIGYYSYDKISNSTTTHRNSNMVSYPTVLPITTQTNSILAKPTETPPSSDLRKLHGGTRTRIQHERRRPLRFCSVPITPRKEVTSTSPIQSTSVRADSTPKTVTYDNHVPLDLSSSFCDASEPKLNPKKKNLAPNDEMFVSTACSKDELVSDSIEPPEKDTAFDYQGRRHLVSSMTNRSTSSNDQSDGCCSIKDSVYTGTTEDTNYDNASSSTIQTDGFDDFLGVYRWDDQPHLRRKKRLCMLLFLLIVAAVVITIVVPISVARTRPSLVDVSTNLTSQQVTSNDDENRSVDVSGLKPLIVGNSAKPTGSEEENYFQSIGLTSSNCHGSQAILYRHQSMLDRSNSVLFRPEFQGVLSENGRRMAVTSRKISNTSDVTSIYQIQIYELSPTHYISSNYSNTVWDLIAELDQEAPSCEKCDPQVLLNEDGSLCAVVSSEMSSVSSLKVTMYRLEIQSSFRASSSLPNSKNDVISRKRRHDSNQQAPSERSTTQSGIRMHEWSTLGVPLTFTPRPSIDHKVPISLSSSGNRLAVAGSSDSQPTNNGVFVFEYNNSTNSWDDQFILEEGEVKAVELSAKGDVLALLLVDMSNSSHSNTHNESPEHVAHYYNWSTFTGDWQLVREHEVATAAYSINANETIVQRLCASFNESSLYLNDTN